MEQSPIFAKRHSSEKHPSTGQIQSLHINRQGADDIICMATNKCFFIAAHSSCVLKHTAIFFLLSKLNIKLNIDQGGDGKTKKDSE